MSDDLHRALQERGNAFRPDRIPPFQGLRERKRRRDQRRAGAAVALSVAAVLGIAVVPNALGSGSDGQGNLADQAGAGAEYVYKVTWPQPMGPVNYEYSALSQRCFDLPGVTLPPAVMDPDPPISGTIQGKANADAFRACAETAAPSASVKVLPQSGLAEMSYSVEWRGNMDAYTPPLVDALLRECVREYGFGDGFIAESKPPILSGRVAGRDANGLAACVRENAPGATLFLAPPALADTISGPVRYAISYSDPKQYEAAQGDTAQRCLGLPGVTDTAVLDSAPPQYGATVTGSEPIRAFRSCVLSIGNVIVRETPPDTQADAAPLVRMYTLLPSENGVLDERLARERAACLALPGVGDILQRQSTEERQVTVTGAQENQAFRECVRKINGLNVPGVTDQTVDFDRPVRNSAEDQAMIDRCVARVQQDDLAREYVRKDAGLLTVSRFTVPTRIIGRDGECLPYTKDLNGKRLNFIINNDVIIWAGRF